MKQSLLKKLWLRTSMLVAVIFCGATAAWGQNEVEIGTVEQLKAFRDAVNSGNQYAGKTVKLTADLDLSGESNWTPIGNLVAYPGQSFNGIFDGDGHTISNVTSSDNTPVNAVAGLFGSIVNGTIKNLTVKNVNITSTHFAGGIVAYTSNGPTIENCQVIGGTIKSTPEIVNGSYDNGDKAGGIMGYATAGSTINNCTVEGVTISGYRDLGGIVGYSAGDVTNNTVKNVTVTQDLTNGYKNPTPTTIGDIVGGGSATLSNNTVIKSDPVAQIGETKYETLAEAVAAANAGDVIEIIKAGDYTLPGLPKNVTIEGKADGVVSFTHTTGGNVAEVTSGATFKNVTFNFGNVDYHGFQHAGTINMEGCTLNGRLTSYGDMSFTNSEFIHAGDYHMWAYSGNLTYTGCTFTNTTTGKFLNVYNEGIATKYTVTVTNCKFINQASSANKAGLNVKATSGSKILAFDVVINNCTTEGAFPEASSSDALIVLNNLVQVDDRTSDGVDNITVTLDSKKIYPINYVAAIGDVKYESLQEAFDAAEAANPENIVIDLLDDATLDITAWSGEKNALSIGTANTKSITINGNNHTLNFNQKNSDWNNVATMNDAETKLVLNNMSITSSGYNSGHWKRYNIFFNCAVELNKVTSDKALGFNNDATLNNVTIEDNRSGVYGIWIKTNGNNVTIDNLTLNSDRGIAIKDEDSQKIDGTSLEISNATFDTNKKAAILVTSSYGVDITAGEDISIENVAADKTNLVWVDEDKATEYYKVTVTGASVAPEGLPNYGATLVRGEQTRGYYKTFADAYNSSDYADGDNYELLKSTTEAVEVNKALTIVKNGFTAENVTAAEGFRKKESEDAIIIKKFIPVCEMAGVQYESLQEALDAAEAADPENIVIALLADATLDITAWDGTKNALSIGTVNTKSITINGNSHTLTFNQKNSDWNNVATMNDAQTKLVLNNMSITSSGYNNGPWNRHDINFNCAVELNNVTSDKALAFKNSATLNNVTVTDNSGSLYGIWISPRVEGQNVSINGLNVTAERGIKIDDEYDSNPGKVTMDIANATFNTTKKAAILVKSKADTDITVGENVNIENVAADKTNAVWVDEDYANSYGLVSVAGATMAPESSEADYAAKIVSGDKTQGYYKTFAAAVAAAEEGQTVVVIAAGSYTLPGISKNITIEGAVEGVVFNHPGAGNVASIPNGATFKNVTFNFGNENYHGFQHAGTIKMEGCTLNGKLFSYGDMNFTGCQFAQSNSDYHMWCYAGNLTYTNCTFTNDVTGKFLNVYNESGATKYTVTVNDSKFINKATAATKAALNVKATSGSNKLSYDVVINNCTTEGAFPVASSSDKLVVLNNLVQVDDRTADGKDNITVTLDGSKIYPIQISTPTIFHDEGTYEGSLDVAIAGEGTIMYKLGADGAATAYTAPITINATTKVTAWAEKDGVKSDEVTKTFTIEPKQAGAEVADGYYTIQTSDGKYVNVAGRKTVTLASDAKSAGTVIRVSADANGVKVLRSQAVDLPRYAERAMSYVPEIVKEVVNKLAGNVDDPIIGEQGTQLILDKFNKEFDYHLYLEGENNTYRIYGRTPSMKPVVDFYAENKELIDGRLLKVEGFVKEVLQKVVDKVGRGQSVVDMFKVKTIWQNMGGTLTEPTDDASTLKFYEEVLSSEKNVWDFAYQTGMLYWEKVKGYLTENAGSLGDYGKYLEKIPNVRPNFRYYIVPGENGVDIISEGNEAILNDNASAAWTLTKRESFDVTLPVEKVVNIYPTSSGGTTTTYNEYYGTLYTDFAYQLPADVVAYKIDGIDVAKGKAYIKKTKLENILPAQTPVMLVSNTADIELTLVAGDVAAVSEGELRGNDYLINEYEINSSQAEGIMMILQKLSESLYNEYEHLQRRNAGTVNNKYFFGLAVDPDLGDAYKAKTGNEMENTPVRVLTKKEDGTIAFTESWNTLAGNESFIFNEEYPDILLSRVGDVNRDGQVTIADVTALVNIVLGKVVYPRDNDKYDFEAANVNGDEQISIADVTALVNIILGK